MGFQLMAHAFVVDGSWGRGWWLVQGLGVDVVKNGVVGEFRGRQKWRGGGVQGYLAHEANHPRRTLQEPYA